MVKFLHSILLLFFFALTAFAQQQPLSNWHTKKIKIQSDTIQLDSLSISPESVEIFNTLTGKKLDTSLYHISDNRIIWKTSSFNTDSLITVDIRYRTLPFHLGQERRHLDTTLIRMSADNDYIGFDYNPYEKEEPLLDFRGLNYSGSFARGISFGNSQNLVLNSNFNLQMSGSLGDDIELLAAISDNSIPLQPEGNTQQLQEFDKIFIQLKRKNSKLIAGDYELARPPSYFMNYYKKLQGATFSHTLKTEDKASLSSSASISIARGQFARNTITAIEGNQGPYKLRGNEGERFIIVLSGTEKVYIDGQLLKRGLEEEYIIDYNRGEITFTNLKLITKDSRIVVDFEYSDQNYLRSLYALNTDYQTERLRLYFSALSEQDSKTSSGQQDLSPGEKIALRNAGDNLQNAFASSIDTLESGFDPDRVMYQMVDTTVNNTLFTQILLYSTNPENARYVARFSDVGQGNGNYIFDSSIPANGRVYVWVAPDSTGMPSGNYEPIVQLIAPVKQQLFTAGVEYQFNDRSDVKAEVGLSNKDLNRFSALDEGDNTGLAFHTAYNHRFILDKKKKNWQLLTQTSYEFVHKHFNQLNPYRNAEFARDWVYDNNIRATEHLSSASIELKNKQLGSLKYTYSAFFRDTLYTGFRQGIKLHLRKKGYELLAEGSLLNADDPKVSSRFDRPRFELSKTFEKIGNWKIGIYGEREQNRQNAIFRDTLLSTSFFYEMIKLYSLWPLKKSISLGVNYTNRKDYAPSDQDFALSTTANEANLHGQWIQKRSGKLTWNLTYRKLKINNSSLSSLDPQDTYLGRLEYSLNLFKGSIRSLTNYEIGSGQEPKVEFNYLEVNPGEGVYQWNDYNGDEVQQINEFETAVFQDSARYIRVSIFTDEFIRTNNVQLNQSLRLSPKAIWHGKKGIKKWLSRLSSQSTLKIIRRTREAEGVSPWNPFQFNINDTALVAVTSSIRNTLFFNRTDPKYGFQIGMLDNRNRIVITTGFDSRRNTEQFFHSRWNINQTVSTQLKYSRGKQYSDSEAFNERDFIIDFFEIQPQLTYLPLKNFRAIFTYSYKKAKNILKAEGENLNNHDFKLETTYNQTTRSAFRARFSFVKVNFDGIPNTPVSFSMLNGLQNGRNYIWNLTYERRLAQNIQLSTGYEGRKTGTSRIIHLGRAQVRATF